MDKTMLIQVTDVAALRVLQNLEAQKLIRILNDKVPPYQARQFQSNNGFYSNGNASSQNTNSQSMFTDWDANSDCRDNDSCDCE